MRLDICKNQRIFVEREPPGYRRFLPDSKRQRLLAYIEGRVRDDVLEIYIRDGDTVWAARYPYRTARYLAHGRWPPASLLARLPARGRVNVEAHRLILTTDTQKELQAGAPPVEPIHKDYMTLFCTGVISPYNRHTERPPVNMDVIIAAEQYTGRYEDQQGYEQARAVAAVAAWAANHVECTFMLSEAFATRYIAWFLNNSEGVIK